jgi:hypothetical protein
MKNGVFLFVSEFVFHSQQPDAGLSARCDFIGLFHVAFVAISSDLALNVGNFVLSSPHQCGVSDQRPGSSRRMGSPSPLADSSKTGIVSVGSMFHPGSQSRKSPPSATNSWISSLVSLLIANLPDMARIHSRPATVNGETDDAQTQASRSSPSRLVHLMWTARSVHSIALPRVRTGTCS